MIKFILSWLLHHANRLPDYRFYLIKNKILGKYGKHLYYDVQFIQGKECYTCGGTGIYDWEETGSSIENRDGWEAIYCRNCGGTGWYKREVWNILSKIQFGKYTFHQPYKKVYQKPEQINTTIEGYVNREPSKYSKLAKVILFLIYDKGYLKRIIRIRYQCFAIDIMNRKNYLTQWIKIKFNLHVSDYELPF